MANTVEIIVNFSDLQNALQTGTELRDVLAQLGGRTYNLNFRLNGMSQTNSELDRTSSKLSRIADTISAISGVGSGLTSALSGFASGITNAFSGMAGMFNTNIAKKMADTLIGNFTNAITSQLSGIIQRYDIMNTFTDYMNLAGVNTDTANAALSRVDQSIRGIPIGLDEAAFRLRRYQMYLGDIDRATNLTIGVQNALMAGGASEQMRNTAYTQIDRLLATGKLSQARQWMSLFNGLGVSLRFLKDELALDPTMSMQQVASDLASGAIATDDFLHAMERLADNQGLTDALNIYKGTIEAWMANIKNAVKRGGQGIIEAFDDVLGQDFGVGITDVLKTVRDGIDSISKAAQNFIRQNPELVSTLGEIAIGFWERIQSADFGGFIQKVVDRLGELADIIFRIIDNLPKGFLSDFLSFAITLAGPLSTIFKMLQGGLPLLLGVFARMKDFDFAGLIEKIVHQVEVFATVVEKVLRLIPDGLLGDLMAFALVWGKPLARIISSVGSAITNLLGGLRGAAGSGFFGAAGSLIRTLGGLIGYPMLGVVSGLAAGIGVIVRQTREYYKEMQQIADANFAKRNPNFDTLVADTENMVNSMNRTREGWQTTVDTIELQAETAHDLVKEIDRIDDQIASTDDIRERNRLIAEQEGLISRLSKVSDLSLTLDSETGLLNEESRAVMGLADSYIELAKAKAMSEAYEANIGEAYQGLFEAQSQRARLGDQRRSLYAQLNKNRAEIQTLEAELDRPHTDLTASGNYEFETSGEDIEDKLRIAKDDRQDIENSIETINEEIENLDEAIANYNKDIEYFGVGLSDVYEELQRLSAIDFTPIEGGESFNNLDENVRNTIAAFNALEEAAHDAIHEIGTGFTEVEATTAQAIGDTIAHLETQKQFFENYNSNMETVLRFAAEHEEYNLSSTFTRLGEIDQKDAAAILAGFASEIEKAKQTGDYSIIESLISESDMALEGEKMATALYQSMMAAASDPEFLKTLQEHSEFFEDGSGFVEAIFGEGFADTVQATAEDGLAPLNEELSDTADNAFNAKIEVGNFASTLDARKGAVTGFTGVLSGMAAVLASEARSVRELNAQLNGLPTNKTVRVSYEQYGFSMPYSSLSTGIGHHAKGGLITGNGIPALAIGTDTVPAMLTPGEYVVRKDAVNMFGQTFLEAVNGMDVGAAYDAMMARVNVPHGSTYNYYDNHATVNQYFSGNTGQGFSQKKAYKFVSTL